jgi:tetratricopeptide (TPR) repeat protein
LISASQAKDTTKAKSFADSAWAAYQKYYFKKAIRLLDSAIFYGNNKSWTYSLKAEAQWFLGMYAEAATSYKQMLSFDDDALLKVSAYVFLGMLYSKAEMPRQATEQFVTAIRLWENGYVPRKQFRAVEESDYFLALAFLGQSEKAKKVMSAQTLDSLTYPERREIEYRHRTYLVLFTKSPKQLLEEQFKEFLLPDSIKPLEE